MPASSKQRRQSLFRLFSALHLPLSLLAALILFVQFFELSALPSLSFMSGFENFFGRGFAKPGFSLPLVILSVLCYFTALALSFSFLVLNRPRARVLMLHFGFGLLVAVYLGSALLPDPDLNLILGGVIMAATVLWIVFAWQIERAVARALTRMVRWASDKENFALVNTILPLSVLFNPDNPDQKRQMGFARHDAGRMADAIDILEPIAAGAEKPDAEILRILDECHRTEKHWDKALEVNQKLLELPGDHEEIRARMARVLEDNNRPDEAIAVMTEGLPSGNGEYLEYLLQLLMKEGKHNEAIQIIGLLADLKGWSPRRAEKACHAILEADPRNLKAAEKLAEMLIQDKKVAAAFNIFEQIIAQDGQRHDLRTRLVHHYQSVNQLDKAEPHLAALMDAGKDSVDIALLYGNILIQREDYDRALLHFQYAVETYRQDYRFAYFLAQISFRTEALDDALRWADEAERRAPDIEDRKRVRSLRSKIHAAMGDRELHVLEERCRREPENADLHLQNLEAMFRHGFIDRAVGEFDIFIHRHPKRRADAVALLQRLTRGDDANYRLLDYLTDLKTQDGEWDEAFALARRMAEHSMNPQIILRERCESILRLEPNHVPCLQCMGEMKLKEHDWQAVTDIHERLLQLKAPNEQKNQQILFDASLKLNRPEKAIEIAERLVKRDAHNIELRIQLVRLYMAGGEFDKAHEQLHAAQSMDYYNADVVALLQTLGESRKRHRLGQLQQIIENEPDNYAAHMEAGDIHGALGETRKSIACYQKAIHEPKYKNFAGVKLANAMIELRMFDLAEESLNEIELRAETREAEDFLKKMCYQAAESFRQEAMHDKAMKLYKKIFRVDAAYKDVVDKIEQLS